MGRFAGVFYFDFRPIPTEDQRQIAGFIGGPDGAGLKVYDAPGLLTAGMTEPPQDNCAISVSGSLCTLEGRVDNHAEVVAEYSVSEIRPPNTAGSSLALAIYEAAATAGLRDLIGDWSLAIWDAKNRCVLLASDYAGIRPLYYHRTAQRLIWSTSLEQIARWSGVTGLDEEYVLDLLSRGFVFGRTPYPGIASVPSGCAVRVTPAQTVTERFWHLPVNRTIRYAHEEEYDEHMRDLFQQAVAVRLNTDAPVCAELSGGLDSSSVVCMANYLIRAGKVKAPSLTSISYRYEGCTDEKFYRAVEQACEIPAIHLEIRDLPLVRPGCAGNASPLMWAPRFEELARQMAAMGSKVLLTGQLGDLIMGNWRDDAEQVADHLRRGHLGRAVREAFAWSHSLQIPVYSVLWRALRADSAVNSDIASLVASQITHGNSLAARFQDKLRSQESENVQPSWRKEKSPARRKRLQALDEFSRGRSLQCPEPLQHMSHSHPYAHRPLVEFMLAIPPAVVCRPGEPRRLMRRALAGIVPATVLRRRSKGSYDTMFLESFRPCAAELLHDPGEMRLAKLGYVDAENAQGRLVRLMQGLDCNATQLRNLILLELWLRQRLSPDGPTGPRLPFANPLGLIPAI